MFMLLGLGLLMLGFADMSIGFIVFGVIAILINVASGSDRN